MSTFNPNRSEVIDVNFRRLVTSGMLPELSKRVSLKASGLSASSYMDLFESQMMSRHLDLAARRFRTRGLTFYTIGSSGHEGNVAHGLAFRHSDMAFLHYRSGAFFIQRSKQLPGSTPLWDGLLSLSASSDDPISQGRHKVFGSYPLFVPPQTSTIASHLPKALGAAMSIRRRKEIQIEGRLPESSVVLCSFGDASFNHATALTAIHAAALYRYRGLAVPIVFVCEDNGIGISVPSPEGWVRACMEHRVGLRYIYCDGLSLTDTYLASKQAEVLSRESGQPVFLHMRTIRLMGHAGSDVETSYRTQADIERTELQDPLLHSARIAIEEGILSGEDIVRIYDDLRRQIDSVGEVATLRSRFTTAKEVMESITPPEGMRSAQKPIDEVERAKNLGSKVFKGKAHFAKLHNLGLADILLQYPQTVLFGEDVAKKGGVYNVTSGLVELFGSKRIFNTHLDETSILGMAIGMAHNGFVPIPEIQFLAYVHNAEDQIRGEAATLSFFSSGQYQNPMVIRVAGLAYQKGFGGHFHNDNSLSIFRDIPGLIVAVPSNGADAVRMFRTCIKKAYEDGRVCVFVEPIALYMTKDLHADGDGGWTFDYPDISESVALVSVRIYAPTLSPTNLMSANNKIVIVTYGNGLYLSLQAKKILEEEGKAAVSVVDLQWINPLPKDALLEAVKDFDTILVVDECRRSGCLGEEVITHIVTNRPIKKIRLHAAEDSFIPLGAAATVTLPSRESIYNHVTELLG
jgi:2-oxoisovalerate dehydrogenase E1 component